MSITILTPSEWNFVPPAQRGAAGGATLLGQQLRAENPVLFLLEEPPDTYTSAHSHSEPEVIVVLEGRLMFNGKWCETGSVIYVPANEDYWHSTGDVRCVVALMRPTTRGKIKYAEEAVAAQ